MHNSKQCAAISKKPIVNVLRAFFFFCLMIGAMVGGIIAEAQPGRPGGKAGARPGMRPPLRPPTHAGVVYGTAGGQPLKLDIYLPRDVSTPVPLVIHIHGGGWQGGNKNGVQPYYFRLVDLGFAVASVQYRLTSQAGQWGDAPVTFPAQIHDVKGAVRWLRANAEKYHLDPERFACWGESAGGHLSALLATSGGVAELEGTIGGNAGISSRVQAAVDYYGPTDLVHMNDDVTTPPGCRMNHDAAGSPESRLIGATDAGVGIGDLKKHWKDAQAPYPALRKNAELVNPVTHVKAGMPPIFIGHGADDVLVPCAQGKRLEAALKQAGNKAQIMIAPGRGHGDLGVEVNEAAIRFLREVLKWI